MHIEKEIRPIKIDPRPIDKPTVGDPISPSVTKPETGKIVLPLVDSHVILSSEVSKIDVRPKKVSIEISYDLWELYNRKAYSRNETMQKFLFRLLELGYKEQNRIDNEEVTLEEI